MSIDDLVQKDGKYVKENPIIENEKFTFKLEAKDVNGKTIKEFDNFDVITFIRNFNCF
jgi:hypothetical protein